MLPHLSQDKSLLSESYIECHCQSTCSYILLHILIVNDDAPDLKTIDYQLKVHQRRLSIDWSLGVISPLASSIKKCNQLPEELQSLQILLLVHICLVDFFLPKSVTSAARSSWIPIRIATWQLDLLYSIFAFQERIKEQFHYSRHQMHKFVNLIWRGSLNFSQSASITGQRVVDPLGNGVSCWIFGKKWRIGIIWIGDAVI